MENDVFHDGHADDDDENNVLELTTLSHIKDRIFDYTIVMTKISQLDDDNEEDVLEIMIFMMAKLIMMMEKMFWKVTSSSQIITTIVFFEDMMIMAKLRMMKKMFWKVTGSTQLRLLGSRKVHRCCCDWAYWPRRQLGRG